MEINSPAGMQSYIAQLSQSALPTVRSNAEVETQQAQALPQSQAQGPQAPAAVQPTGETSSGGSSTEGGLGQRINTYA